MIESRKLSKCRTTGYAVLNPRQRKGILREEIAARNILKKDVARFLDILPHHLSEIFARKRNISVRLAAKPKKLFGISSHYWLGLQMEYDLFVARREEA